MSCISHDTNTQLPTQFYAFSSKSHAIKRKDLRFSISNIPKT